MTYIELLQQEEWSSKCNEILTRDHFTCRHCGSIGYHNGGCFVEINDIEEASNYLKKFTFYDKPFLEFYEWMQEQEDRIKRKEVLEIKYCNDWEKKYETLDYYHFIRPIINNITDIGGFPLVVPKGVKPSHIIQFSLNLGIKSISDKEPCGELFEFILPDLSLSNNYLCIEGYDYRNYLTVQIQNKIFAMIFASRLRLFKGLNIHHKYYLMGHKPWEYDNGALVTLCEDCHRNWHLRNPIYVYDNHNPLCKCNRCDRCGGSGYLPQYSYVQNGICFKCGGEGVIVND